MTVPVLLEDNAPGPAHPRFAEKVVPPLYLPSHPGSLRKLKGYRDQ